MPFGSIIVAVDGSEASREALDQAVFLSRQSHAALTGIFVLDNQWADYIGNDWQSSSKARQGFLEHIDDQQRQQAEAARAQFEQATRGIDRAAFAVLAGDPASVMLEQLNHPQTDLLVFGRRTFQVSGRPSLKSAAKTLASKAKRPLLLLP